MKQTTFLLITLTTLLTFSCKLDLPAFKAEDITFSNSKISLTDSQKLDLLNKFAPVIYHNTRGDIPGGYTYHRTGDFMLRIDFDGDWNSLNNWENCAADKGDMKGYAYASIVETETHWFAGYHFFHAIDDAVFKIDRHENDMEDAYICIRKSDETVEGIITNKHGWHLYYSSHYKSKGSIILENNRVTLYISSNGSGADFGHGVEAWKGENKHPFIYDLVKYEPTQPASRPEITNKKIDSAGYDLILLDDPDYGIWDKRNNEDFHPFGPWGGFGGDTNGAGASPPWGWASRFAMFHPAQFFATAFPEILKTEYSFKYTYNNYAEEGLN
jgi:hypothetical protein